MSLSPDKKHFISFCLTFFFRFSAPSIKSSTTCLLFSSIAKLNSSFISFIFFTESSYESIKICWDFFCFKIFFASWLFFQKSGPAIFLLLSSSFF